MPPLTFGGIFASAPRVNAGRKRFRSLIVDIIGYDVEGVSGMFFVIIASDLILAVLI